MIAEKVWGYGFESYSNAIDVHVNSLRKKVDRDFEPKLIHTVEGNRLRARGPLRRARGPSRMARPLSIGARWTLRYAVFTSVVLGLFAYLLYAEFRERVERDATLVVRLQFKELAEELEKHRRESRGARAPTSTPTSRAQPQDLQLGIRIFDRDGRISVEEGVPDRAPACRRLRRRARRRSSSRSTSARSTRTT